MAWRRRIRPADLFRFQRLYEHGDRARPDDGLPPSAQFRHALHRALHRRILAALAHLAVALVPRLPLHSAWRQSPWPAPNISQSRYRIFLVRPVAWRRWTFILWGMYHGMLLVIERLGLETALRKTPAPIQHAYALLAVVFGWVLFRADSFEQAIGVLTRMVVPTSSDEVGVLQFLPARRRLLSYWRSCFRRR